VSGENVEVVRQGNAAVRRRDWDTVAANLDPHVIVRTDARWPEQRIYGREAVIAWYRDLCEQGGSDVSIEETMDLGDRVLTRLRWSFQGQLSGIESEQLISAIATFRDRRIILEEFFLEHQEALKALGLEQ
jgi:hypothetical protein